MVKSWMGSSGALTQPPLPQRESRLGQSKQKEADMNVLGRFVFSVIVTTGVAATTAWAYNHAKGEGFISVKASAIKWADAPSVGPGAKIAVLDGDLKAAAPFTFRLKLPPESKLGVHTHPTFERVTVLSGSFYFATGDKFDAAKVTEYGPGDAFMVPPGMPMYGYTKKEEVVVQIHGTGPWGITYLDAAADAKKKK